MDSESECSSCTSDEKLEFPCLPNCSSQWHCYLRRENKISSSYFVIPSDFQKNTYELPPLAPNSIEPRLIRSSTTRSYRQMVPDGCFLSQGFFSLKSTNEELECSSMVFIPPSNEQDDDTSSGSNIRIPVCADVLNYTNEAMRLAKAHAVQVNYRHSAQTLDINRLGDINDMVSSVGAYHKVYSDLMLETARITDDVKNLIPHDKRMESIPVPSCGQGDVQYSDIIYVA